MNAQPMKTKANKYTCRLRYITNTRKHNQNWQIQKTEQHIYEGPQNRTQLHFGEPRKTYTNPTKE